MVLTFQEICIFHLYTLEPMRMLGYTTKWDLASAYEYHQSMAQGNRMEQAAATSLSVMDVFQTMHSFLSAEGPYADDDVMGAYIMDQGMYEKLRYYLHGDICYKEEIA